MKHCNLLLMAVLINLLLTFNTSAQPPCGFTYTIYGDSVSFTGYSTGSFKWTFGDGDSSILQNPIHIYSTNRKYKVCMVATDSVFGSCNVCDSITVPQYTGISLTENKDVFLDVYPNPFRGTITINYHTPLKSESAIRGCMTYWGTNSMNLRLDLRLKIFNSLIGK